MTNCASGCGLARLDGRIVPSPHPRAEGRSLLVLDLFDLAGHEARATWHLDGR